MRDGLGAVIVVPSLVQFEPERKKCCYIALLTGHLRNLNKLGQLADKV